MTEQRAVPTVFSPGNVAVVTGAAGGIGRAAARRFAGLGMKVVLADIEGPALASAADEIATLAGGAQNTLALPTDVSRMADLALLREATFERFGPVSVLMNNAGVGNNPGLPWENGASWKVYGPSGQSATAWTISLWVNQQRPNGTLCGTREANRCHLPSSPRAAEPHHTQ